MINIEEKIPVHNVLKFNLMILIDCKQNPVYVTEMNYV
jgi:hypothetical protein